MTVNKSSKSFLSDKYQTWYAEEVAEQLRRGVAPHDVKVDVRLLAVKPLHAQWVVDFYKHMQLNAGKNIVRKGFRKGLIREAYDQASALQNLTDNPFQKMDIDFE